MDSMRKYRWHMWCCLALCALGIVGTIILWVADIPWLEDRSTLRGMLESASIGLVVISIWAAIQFSCDAVRAAKAEWAEFEEIREMQKPRSASSAPRGQLGFTRIQASEPEDASEDPPNGE